MTDVVVQLTEGTQIRVGVFKEKYISISKFVYIKDANDFRPKSGQTFPIEKTEEVVKAILQAAGLKAGAETTPNAEPEKEKKPAKAEKHTSGIRYLILADRPDKASDLDDMLGNEDFDFASEEEARSTDGWAKDTVICKTKVENGKASKFKILAKFNRTKNTWVDV